MDRENSPHALQKLISNVLLRDLGRILPDEFAVPKTARLYLADATSPLGFLLFFFLAAHL